MTFIRISPYAPIASAASRAMAILGLSVWVLFPGELAAQGQPVQNGPALPLAIWWVGACVLGLAIAYGILRNRTRTRADKNLTEQATKNLYAEEERDRIQSGSP
jgi:phosphate/sulfate permease